MASLDIHYEMLCKACKKFERIIVNFEKAKEGSEEHEERRDSLVKRFEFSYGLFWNYLKHYLEEKKGVEVASARSIFQECLKQKIANEEEVALLLRMVDDRNLTSHTYDEEAVQEMALRITKYHPLILSIAERTQK